MIPKHLHDLYVRALLFPAGLWAAACGEAFVASPAAERRAAPAFATRSSYSSFAFFARFWKTCEIFADIRDRTAGCWFVLTWSPAAGHAGLRNGGFCAPDRAVSCRGLGSARMGTPVSQRCVTPGWLALHPAAEPAAVAMTAR